VINYYVFVFGNAVFVLKAYETDV